MERVACAVCQTEVHAVPPHLETAHNKMPLEDYIAKYPDSDLFSPAAFDIVAEVEPEVFIVRQQRKTKKPCIDLFGFKGGNATVFEHRGEHVPAVNPEFVFPSEQTKTLLYALDKERENTCWIGGESGSGKSTLVMQVCARTNRELARLNFDHDIRRADLVGEWTVKNGATIFNYGMVPLAMVRGALLLLDEADCANPYTWNVLRPILEDPPRMVLLEVGGKVIHAHPDFRVVITGNSFGYGDESGQYATVHNLSIADTDRISYWIELNYLKPEDEIKVVRKRFSKLKKDDAEKFVDVANHFRDAYTAKKLSRPISTRVLLTWVDTTITMAAGGTADPAFKAAELCFLNQMPGDSRLAGLGLLERVFTRD